MRVLLLAFLAIFVGRTATTAAPAGEAVCDGTFQLDGLAVPDTATLFPESRIDTLSSVCTIRLRSGAAYRLGPGIAATVIAGALRIAQAPRPDPAPSGRMARARIPGQPPVNVSLP